MTKLKPCPFCGKQIEIKVTKNSAHGLEAKLAHRVKQQSEYYITCSCLPFLFYGTTIDGNTEESVITKWNQRPLEYKLKVECNTWKAKAEAYKFRIKELKVEHDKKEARIKELLQVMVEMS